MATSFYTLTEDEKTRIEEYISENGVNRSCCRNPRWTIFGPVVSTVASKKHSGGFPGTETVAGLGFPLILVSCATCAETKFYSAHSIFPEWQGDYQVNEKRG